MTKTRSISTAASAIALAAATTVAVAPAHADTPAAPTHTVQYVAQGTGTGSSDAGGSLEDEFVQTGLLIVAGLGVSALLAISAGVAGGAIPLPEIPGMPI